MDRLYKELFHQAAFLLAKDGRMLLVMKQQPELLQAPAAAFKMQLLSTHEFWQGNEKLTALVFGK
jgi:16S rRNA G1207 methylase RsmC